MTVWLQEDDWTYEYFDLDVEASNFPGAEDFIELWKHKRGNHRIPMWSEYKWEDLFPWAGNIILTDVLWDPYDYQYRLFATKVVDRYLIDITGKKASELTKGNYIVEPGDIEFNEMVSRGPYISKIAGPLYWQSREHINTAFVEVPLSNSGERVTHGLALMI